MARNRPALFDVVIIGAGPAGCAAGLHLARRGRQVALLDAATFPRPKSCGGWTGPQLRPLLDDLGLPASKLLTERIEQITLCNADLSKTVEPALEQETGFLVDRGKFDHALVKEARKQLTVLEDHAVLRIQIEENGVSLDVAGQDPVRARFLVVAAGLEHGLLEATGLRAPHDAEPVRSAFVQATSAPTKQARVTVVIGVPDIHGFAVCVQRGSKVSVTLHSREAAETLPTTLAGVCGGLFRANLLGSDLTAAAVAAEIATVFPFGALEMESHVGKHTLLVGDAGGFLSHVSHEGIYPAMWSATIAAEVLHEALESSTSQDVLMTFDSRWRIEMGDYLRPPNTDLPLLLPLVFSNKPMARRMAAAFFCGENI